MVSVEEFLSRPLVARLATAGPTIRPIWFLWESGAFWWITGGWSDLERSVSADPRVALLIDTCDLDTGEILQVTAAGTAEVLPLSRDIAFRALARYLGPDPSSWPNERFLVPLYDPGTHLVRLQPDAPPVLQELSFPAERFQHA